MLLPLIYLLLTIVLSYIYVIVFFYIAKSVFHVINVFFTTKWGCFGCLPDANEVRSSYLKRFREKLNFSFSEMLPRSKLIQFLILTVVLSIFLYGYERQQWIKESTVYKEAKEYFVAGEVLADYRKIFASFIPPDSLLLWPLHTLQTAIYNSGTALIPKEDAEDAMWYQMWFIYPYSVRDYSPYGTWEVKHGRDDQQAWLEKVWVSVEKLSNPVFKDKQMYEAYLKGFPGLAFYYSLNQVFYYDEDVPNAIPYLRTIPKHINRNEMLRQGLITHKQEWDSAKMDETFGRKYPKVKVLMYLSMMNVTEFLMQSSITAHTFRCDMNAVQDYVKARNALVGPDGEESGPIYALKPQEQEPLFAGFIDGTGPYFYKYMTKEICHYEVYGILQKEWQSPKNTWTEKLEYERVERWYEKELKNLQQTLKGEKDGNSSRDI